MKPKSSKGAQTKARIIRAAADLFHKQGVGSTSPDDIIEASGTGKGQFYHYFKSKEGLVHEVLQNHLHAIKSGSARRSTTKSPRGKVWSPGSLVRSNCKKSSA